MTFLPETKRYTQYAVRNTTIARLIDTVLRSLGRDLIGPGRPTLALAALVLLIGAVACSPIAAGPPATQIPAYTFYRLRFNPGEETMLVPLDPTTLADQPDGRTLEPGLFSADGSTWVDVEYLPGRNINDPDLNPDEMWIVVHDVGTGTERSRFHPPFTGIISALSQDGTRLALEPFPPTTYPLIAEWYVLDTGDGQLLAHVKDPGASCFRGGTGWFDPSLRERVYCPLDPEITEAEEPEPMHIIAYDLENGDKVGDVELPQTLIGGWETGQTVDGQPVWASLEPAMALSPDGEQLAVVHADAEQVTLIEAESLSVERTITLKHPTSLLDRFAPAVAQAKGPSEGTIRQAVYGPGGRYLYVFSQEFWVEPEDAPAERGLWLVDLDRGVLVAEVLPEFQIQWVRPAPDGSLYVFGTTDDLMAPFEIRATSPSTLWRLDALTLKTLAQREFTGYQAGRLIPAQPTD